MTQYFFRAADYAVGTNLRQLGFALDSPDTKSAVVSSEYNSRKAFIRGDSETAVLVVWFPLIDSTTTQFDISLVGQTSPDPASYVAYFGAQGYTDGRQAPESIEVNLNEAIQRNTDGNSNSIDSKDPLNQTETKETDNPLIVLKLSVEQDQVWYKVWYVSSTSDLLSEEPSSWEGPFTYDYTQTGYPGVSFLGYYDLASRIETISFGTNGDIAPVVRNESFVEVQAPTNLSATNITTDSATLTWD